MRKMTTRRNQVGEYSTLVLYAVSVEYIMIGGKYSKVIIQNAG